MRSFRYRIAFDVELRVVSFMYWFERFIDVFFIVDIFLNFRTTFYDAVTNAEVFDRRRCAVNYLRSWFLLDVAASIPVELIAQIKGLSSGTGGGDTSFAGLSAQEVKALKLLKLGKLIRAVRMIRLAQTGKFALLQEKIEDESIRYGLDNVIRQTMALSTLIFLLLYVCETHTPWCPFMCCISFHGYLTIAAIARLLDSSFLPQVREPPLRVHLRGRDRAGW